jgi:hypothetical protein
LFGIGGLSDVCILSLQCVDSLREAEIDVWLLAARITTFGILIWIAQLVSDFSDGRRENVDWVGEGLV